MKKTLLILTAAVLVAACAPKPGEIAQAPRYEQKSFLSPSTDSTLLFCELDPVVKARKYPLVIFLHGAGERGSDNNLQLIHGSGQFLNPANAEKHPSYVLFPQCPVGTTWAYDYQRPWFTDPYDLPVDNPESRMEKLLIEFITTFIAEHPDVDTRRVYIMGLSMGAIGTYDLVPRYPELFAAAVPICGCVNPTKMAAAKDVAFSIYHGDKDPTVPVAGSREAYKALKAAGASVRYHEFVGCDHGSWNPAFNQPDFITWLYRQHK